MYSWQHCGTGTLNYRQPFSNHGSDLKRQVIMVQFLSIIFFLLDFFNFCWVFQKFPFFCVSLYLYIHTVMNTTILQLVAIYRVSQEECATLRESVPYVQVYRYNQNHLYPKLNGYGDNGQRKVRSSCGTTYCACLADALEVYCECPWDWNAVNIVQACPCNVLGTLRTTTALMRVFM